MSDINHPPHGLDAIEYHKDLSSLHYFRFPVFAERYVRLCTDQEVFALFNHPEWDGKATVLGKGSNVLITQHEIAGWVLSLEPTGIEVLSETANEVVVRVGAGVVWDDFVAYSIAQGWGGLESLSSIPGTVGAALVQNIGAYGYEIADCLVSCRSVHLATGKIKLWQAKDCECAYRHSVFKTRSDHLLLEVTLRLKKSFIADIRYQAIAEPLLRQGIKQPTPLQVRDVVVAVRQAKLPDPSVYPNAGSFFKNPMVSKDQLGQLVPAWPGMRYWAQSHGVKLSAAWLIEACGLKGYSMGGVAVSSRHALVLTHDGTEQPEKMVALMHHIQSMVRDRFGVLLEPEVTLI